MSKKKTSDSTNWLVIHRVVFDEGEHLLPRLRITDVPNMINKTALKADLEKAGRIYSEGPYLWGNHQILCEAEWPAILDSEKLAKCESLTYVDLVDEANGEKRVTLRIPIGLHAALIKASAGTSLNQYCIKILSDALQQTTNTAELSPKWNTDKMRPDMKNDLLEMLQAKISLPPETLKRQMNSTLGEEGTLEKLSSFANMSEERIEEMMTGTGCSREQAQKTIARVREAMTNWPAQVEQFQNQSPEELQAFAVRFRDGLGKVKAEELDGGSE